MFRVKSLNPRLRWSKLTSLNRFGRKHRRHDRRVGALSYTLGQKANGNGMMIRLRPEAKRVGNLSPLMGESATCQTSRSRARNVETRFLLPNANRNTTK